jgi:hypothetical protein
MENNYGLSFQVVAGLVNKAISLGYEIDVYSYDDDGVSFQIYDNKSENYLSFSFKKKEDNYTLTALDRSSHGYISDIEITREEFYLAHILKEKVTTYQEHQLIKNINNFFPREEEKKKDINDLDDEND